jgi:uncharacterized protein (TIGR00645 family)
MGQQFTRRIEFQFSYARFPMSATDLERAAARPIPLVQPKWLSHVNASVLQVKLATAIIRIRSIRLPKTFINAKNYSPKVLIAQTVIHFTFLLSAMAVASTDRLTIGAGRVAKEH